MFYAEKESDTGCPQLASQEVEVIRMSGGHHFGGNYSVLADGHFERFEAPDS